MSSEDTAYITFSNEEVCTDLTVIKDYFKNNLAGQTITHPKIGEINIYKSSYDETRHHLPKYFMALLLKLPEIIRTSTTNGIINPDKGKHVNCVGFIYLYGPDLISVRTNIWVDKQGKKYYVIHFNKNENHVLNPKIFKNLNLSEGSNMAYNNIITDLTTKIKCGDIITLNDSTQIKVLAINNKSNIANLIESIANFL